MMAPEQIGGAIVRRTFNASGRNVRPGEHLSAEEVRTFAHNNLRALVDANFIDLVPAAQNDAAGARHVIHRGSGRFDVIQGVVLNVEPLSREEADALAGTPSISAAA